MQEMGKRGNTNRQENDATFYSGGMIKGKFNGSGEIGHKLFQCKNSKNNNNNTNGNQNQTKIIIVKIRIILVIVTITTLIAEIGIQMVTIVITIIVVITIMVQTNKSLQVFVSIVKNTDTNGKSTVFG